MIVEDELDRGRGRMGGVELFQEFDEFARAMSAAAWTTRSSDDAASRLRPQSNVFVIARDGPMTHGLGRQVVERRMPGFQERSPAARLLASGFRRLFLLFDLAIDGNDLGHLRASGSRRSR